MTAVSAAYLVAYVTVLFFVLSLLLLLMIAELSGATWLQPWRRHADALIGTLPVLAVLFLPIVVMSRLLYPWLTPGSLPASVRAIVAARSPYLTPAFALARTVVYWAVWIGVGESLRSLSMQRDATRLSEANAARRLRVLTAAGIPLVALTVTFASFDWMMSTDASWVSSIYGLYVFAGGLVAALALLVVIASRRARTGSEGEGASESLDALGKLLLMAVLLWGYVAYMQYLVIWIADLPSEAGWYVLRSRDGWGGLAIVLVFGHFALPFLLLLARSTRQSATRMQALGLWMLLMHYLDVYWLLAPSLGTSTPAGRVWEVLMLILVVVVTVAGARWRSPRDRFFRSAISRT